MPVNRRGMGHLRTSHVGFDHGIDGSRLTSAYSGDQQQGSRGLTAEVHGQGLQCSTWMASMRASSSGEILTSIRDIRLQLLHRRGADDRGGEEGPRIDVRDRHLGRIEAEFHAPAPGICDGCSASRIFIALAASKQGRARARRAWRRRDTCPSDNPAPEANRRAATRAHASRFQRAPLRRSG